MIIHRSILIGSTYSKNFNAYLNQKMASFLYSSLVLKRNSNIFKRGIPESLIFNNIYCEGSNLSESVGIIFSESNKILHLFLKS